MHSYVSLSSFNPGAKFIILFINPDVRFSNAEQLILARQMFSLMYDRYNAANVVFLMATDADSYKIFVTNPYMNQNMECGNEFDFFD